MNGKREINSVRAVSNHTCSITLRPQYKSPSGKASGSIELELQLVSLEDDEEQSAAAVAAAAADAAAAAEEAGQQEPAGPGPKSVLEDIDWNVLGQRMGGKAMGLGRFQLACFLTNEVRGREKGEEAVCECRVGALFNGSLTLPSLPLSLFFSVYLQPTHRRQTRRAPSGATRGPRK
jgi:hypothetical protein